MNSQLDSLADFYLPHCQGQPNLFEIWEDGGARGDSVTPATHSARYQAWMHTKLVDALAAQDTKRLLSLGSGNATIEGMLARQGYDVLAVDALAEAKGVAAVQADIADWSPRETWPVVYMDGVLGHLYDPVDHSLLPVLRRIRSWLDGSALGTAPRGGTFIASNDSTQDGEAAQAAPGVMGFHWLSVDFLGAQALAAGFEEVETETFTYQRPLSGDRVRSVITAHVVRKAPAAASERSVPEDTAPCRRARRSNVG